MTASVKSTWRITDNRSDEGLWSPMMQVHFGDIRAVNECLKVSRRPGTIVFVVRKLRSCGHLTDPGGGSDS